VVRQWIANPLSPVRIWVPPFVKLNYNIVFRDYSIYSYIYVIKIIVRECGGIGRHDGLKIRCLVIGVRVQVPPFPIVNEL
jgi:hypothetical protein